MISLNIALPKEKHAPDVEKRTTLKLDAKRNVKTVVVTMTETLKIVQHRTVNAKIVDKLDILPIFAIMQFLVLFNYQYT